MMGRVRLFLIAVVLMTANGARASVERVEVLERTPFAAGHAFGVAGSYEKIRGVAFFALDPNAKANRSIVDLNKAPKDNRGLVVFKSDFVMLRPLSGKAGTLLYDVNNRGGIAILGQVNGKAPVNNDPTTLQDAGDGFLMRHGFTLLFSAWTWDVAPQGPEAKPLVFAPPVARARNGTPITGTVENEFTVTSPMITTTYAGQRGLTYEPAVPDDPAAVLTRRALPEDPRIAVERRLWRFVPPLRAGGPGQISLNGGFQTGVLYELTYTAKDPYVTGAGLAGVRDLLAYLRDHPFEGAAPPSHTLIFGISQSGRFIGRMLHDGLDVDEQGRLAFDGAFLEVPGAGGSGGFNSRFVQPTRHPSMLEEHDYPSDAFPFTTAPTLDPATGLTGSYLDHARDASGHLPKLIFANTSTEFWNRDASLIATTADGIKDVPPLENTRLYAFMGAQHYVGRSRTRSPYLNCVSTTDHYLPMRALVLALERWVGGGSPPPPSAYPHVADGALITAEAYHRAFPKGIALTPPLEPLAEPRLDFGPRFDTNGVQVLTPPRRQTPYGARVPAPDSDGNDLGGVRMVELEVPLGTHTGWNQRSPETGFAWATARFDGSFLPFTRTKAERAALNDPRPSLAERYPTREDFVAKVNAAALRQLEAGFLLPEDVERAEQENATLYDRLLQHDPADRSCSYLFGS